jgi:hypothetical protein
MSIAGNLKTMPLSELLQWLGHSAKSGTLVIDNHKVQKKVYFRDGRIISSSSTDPREYLGHFLVSYGFISEEELTKAVAMQEQSRMLLGKILTTIGAISEDDLHRLLRQKAEEAVYDVFSWPEGEFRFLDAELPEHAMIPMNLEVTAIVLEGAHRLDEWKRIRAEISTNKVIPVSVTDLLADPKLNPGQRQVLEFVNDDRTIEEIQVDTHSSEYRVSKVIFEQFQKGRLKLIKPRWETGPKVAEANGAPVPVAAPLAVSPAPVAAVAAPTGEIDADLLLAQAQAAMAAANYEKALRFLRAARALEPDAKKTQTALQQGEEQVTAEIERAGVTLASIPKLERSMQELTTLQLTQHEGLMMTRINGTYDIRSIVKTGTMPQVEALLVFYRLLEKKHISVR